MRWLWVSASALCLLAFAGPTLGAEMCYLCTCLPDSGSGPSLNCSARGLTRHFANDSESVETDWLWDEQQLAVAAADFSHNDLVRVRQFPELPSLKKLDLSHNRIQELDDRAFQMLQALEELDLSYNEIVSVALRPEVFHGVYAMPDYLPLVSLRILDLSSNALHTLDQDVFEHVERIEVLDLSGNKFDLIDNNAASAIGSLFALKSLDLSYTNIESLPDSFLHIPKELQQLRLRGNRFRQLPTDLANAHNLSLLDLGENLIEYVNMTSPFPESLSSLTTLFLNDMASLRAVDATAMSSLTGLLELHMNNNKRLSSIKGELPYNIRKLWLNNNNLSALSGAQELGRLDRMQLVDIRQNPWLCDCDADWLVTVLTPLINNTTPELLDGLACASPPEMEGVTLYAMSVRHYRMRCLPTDGSRPERDAAMLIGILLGLLMGLACFGVGVLLHRRRLLPSCFSCETGPAAYSRGFYKRAGSTTTEEFY